MKILVANDDGIRAEGIHRLAAALAGRGDVYVFAPDKQRSASSHALNMHEPIGVTELPAAEFPEAQKAWAVSGTPADCVKIGLEFLKTKGLMPDIVYAGINHGSNIGTDVMYSGTVSAAAEGALYGLPAVAVSVCDHHPQYFEKACALAEAVFDRALTTAGSGSVISINTPNLPAEQIKGVKAARLGIMKYNETFDVVPAAKLHAEASAGEKTIFYTYTGSPIEVPQEADSDVRLTGEGWATISMVRYDLNDDAGLRKLTEWEMIK